MYLGIPLSLIPLYVQTIGTFLFCLVFLFLWRQSGIVYFRFWSVAWATLAAALMSAFCYFWSGSKFWLAPYALLEFAFALSLVAAARAGPIGPGSNWRFVLKGLGAFPLFLMLVYALGLTSTFEGYSGLHALVVGAIYLYSYITIRGNTGIGGRMFRFSLACLSIAFFHHGVSLLMIHYSSGPPHWVHYVQCNSLFDFALHTLLAFSAMAMWIENQHDRLKDMKDELDRVRRESLTYMDQDHLTGLLNRLALDRRMQDEQGLIGVVTVCDMDNFKSINDHYGHLVGDEILRNVGHLLRGSIRQQDEAYRWGGDEFVILFHNQDRAVARNRMDEIRSRLKEFRVRGYGTLPISFSYGTAESDRTIPLAEILNRADQDMYTFKRRRVVRESRRADAAPQRAPGASDA